MLEHIVSMVTAINVGRNRFWEIYFFHLSDDLPGAEDGSISVGKIT